MSKLTEEDRKAMDETIAALERGDVTRAYYVWGTRLTWARIPKAKGGFDEGDRIYKAIGDLQGYRRSAAKTERGLMEPGWEIKKTYGGSYFVDGYAGHLFTTVADASTALKLAQQMVRNEKTALLTELKKQLGA